MSVTEDLRAARALIDTPEKWCKHNGEIVEGESVRRCALRSLTFAVPPVRLSAARVAFAAQISGRYIVHWNDDPERTHADVMAAFDAAIASAE